MRIAAVPYADLSNSSADTPCEQIEDPVRILASIGYGGRAALAAMMLMDAASGKAILCEGIRSNPSHMSISMIWVSV